MLEHAKIKLSTQTLAHFFVAATVKLKELVINKPD